MVDATSFLNSNFTLRGRLDGLLNPESGMLAISPGSKVAISVTDESGRIAARTNSSVDFETERPTTFS